jgi:hypothetical protein
MDLGVAPELDGSVSIAGGGHRFCAVARDGRVSCRGHDRYGELGRGTSVTVTRPTEVPSLDAVTAVRGFHEYPDGGGGACALHRDGTVSCWGTMSRVDPIDRTRPSRVVGVSDVVEFQPPCARRRDGSIVCWSRDRWGVGAAAFPSHDPLVVIDHAAQGIRQFQVEARNRCGCLLDGTGTLHCWQDDLRARPMQQLRNVASFALHESALSPSVGCAHLTTGELRCWQSENAGRCDASVPNAQTMTYPVPSLAGSTQTAQGTSVRCARMTDGRWRCINISGSSASEPWPSGEMFDDDVELAANSACWCGRSPRGAVRCIGSNFAGSFGTNLLFPEAQVALSQGASQIAPIGRSAWCALRDGRVLCWGANDHAELGLGTWDTSFPIAPILDP